MKATHHIPVRSAGGRIEEFTFTSQFQLTLQPADPIQVQNALQGFERNLHSSDPEVRHEALDVLATTAPPYLESTAMRLLRDEDSMVVLHAVAAPHVTDCPSWCVCGGLGRMASDYRAPLGPDGVDRGCSIGRRCSVGRMRLPSESAGAHFFKARKVLAKAKARWPPLAAVMTLPEGFYA